MNPYLKAMPPLPAGFEASMISDPSIEKTVKQLVQQHNLLTYIDYTERLPSYSVLQRDLKQKGISPTLLPAILWTLGQTYELLPVPLAPEMDQFGQIHFLINTNAILDTYIRNLAQEVGALYHKVTGSAADLTRIFSVSKNPAFYYEMTDEHRKLFVHCRILSILSDYREIFQRDHSLMEPENIKERRSGALSVLERMSNRPEMQAPSVAKPEVSKEEGLHFTMSGMELDSPVQPEPTEESPRRAVDLPEWKKFETAQKSGFSWEMVMRTFGPNMVIRILLRRQDYGVLLAMIEDDFITDRNELKYCLQSLDKIKKHGDLQPEHEQGYLRLYQYLKGQGF